MNVTRTNRNHCCDVSEIVALGDDVQTLDAMAMTMYGKGRMQWGGGILANDCGDGRNDKEG